MLFVQRWSIAENQVKRVVMKELFIKIHAIHARQHTCWVFYKAEAAHTHTHTSKQMWCKHMFIHTHTDEGWHRRSVWCCSRSRPPAPLYAVKLWLCSTFGEAPHVVSCMAAPSLHAPNMTPAWTGAISRSHEEKTLLLLLMGQGRPEPFWGPQQSLVRGPFRATSQHQMLWCTD